MNTWSKWITIGSLMAVGSQAQAIMVTDWTHNSGSTASDYTLTIVESMDMTRFNFTLSVDMGFSGDLLALGFNGLDYNSMNLDAMGADIASTYFDTLDCAQGCNFNGDGNPGSFDVIIKFGSQGMGSGAITSTSFSIAKLMFSLDDFTDFGVRAQTTGVAGCIDEDEAEEMMYVSEPVCGSDKAYASVPPPPPNEVSEASPIALLGLGLLGLGFAARRARLS